MAKQAVVQPENRDVPASDDDHAAGAGGKVDACRR